MWLHPMNDLSGPIELEQQSFMKAVDGKAADYNVTCRITCFLIQDVGRPWDGRRWTNRCPRHVWREVILADAL